jgi:hypothetical protein
MLPLLSISNGTQLITQLIFLFPVPCSLSQRVNLILSDYLTMVFINRQDAERTFLAPQLESLGLQLMTMNDSMDSKTRNG